MDLKTATFSLCREREAAKESLYMENSLKMKVELVREERRRRVEEWERWHTETENMDNNKQQKSSKKVTIPLTEEEEQK